MAIFVQPYFGYWMVIFNMLHISVCEVWLVCDKAVI